MDTQKPFKRKKVKDPWNFDAPSYDDRDKQQAGDYYGVGIRNPVGKLKRSYLGSAPIKNKVAP